MSTNERDTETKCPDEKDDEARQEHLRQLGMMLLGIAHELNTPLGVVASTCDSLDRCRDKLAEVLAKPSLDAADHERLRAILGHMEAGAPVLTAGLDRMQGLVRELRLTGRGEGEARHEPSSLTSILDGALLLLHFELKQGVTVERKFEVEPLVAAHPVFLGQVFINLLRNAVQAMDGEGTITLGVRERGDQVEVEIADTGPGIPPDLLPELFTREVTTKCPETGTGLGLMICRKIVEKHGGAIVAANGAGGGAVFTVTLPRA